MAVAVGLGVFVAGTAVAVGVLTDCEVGVARGPGRADIRLTVGASVGRGGGAESR